jgi:hypothetical protein
VFAEAGVNIEALRDFLCQHELALISVRDAVRRDGFDTAQPFNLPMRVGHSSVKPGSNAPLFMVELRARAAVA